MMDMAEDEGGEGNRPEHSNGDRSKNSALARHKYDILASDAAK